MSENPQNPNAFELSSFAPDDASLTVHRMAAHDRLAYQSRVVLRLGQMLLAAGAGSYRVKASMRTCAEAVGIEKHHAQVTFTEVVATAYANGTFRTELAEQRLLGVNADRIDRITNYLATIEGTQVLVEDVDKALDEIERVKPLYGWLANALASGLACAAWGMGGVLGRCNRCFHWTVPPPSNAQAPHEPLRCVDGVWRRRCKRVHPVRLLGAKVHGD